ncbi:PEP-CTERM sorting domain-containing protein [Aquincola sp. S2]|uniref:PEP-CTERM sorting domain-containing protein n=1 Tax=Pseudaquabacterium terrae TaxID=2732868 RepID=A0ABX2ETT8_9BURK|nr:choice-of-anchor L domain-containing protein [Aquabacterium terrae]NRF71905.1 PEP-CTERM sorting domain-containing protein [Aquabacterium terrae]
MFKQIAAACALAAAAVGAQAVAVTSTKNADTLATAIVGAGISFSNATLTSGLSSPSGTFTGGGTGALAPVGFDTGIVLTTGTTDCVPASTGPSGPNALTDCTGDGGGATVLPNGETVFDFTSLKFDFESDTGKVFFKYVFASEEYTDFVGQGFNDKFELLLNGVNIATVPGGPVEVDNINCTTNSNLYRNNARPEEINNCASLGLDIEYDGLTVVLKASGLLVNAVNTFEFRIYDRGDDALDSAVFIEAGSFTSVDPDPVPEPGTLVLAGVALAGLAAASRRRRT